MSAVCQHSHGQLKPFDELQAKQSFPNEGRNNFLSSLVSDCVKFIVLSGGNT